MQNAVILLCYMSIVLSAIAGIARYRYMETSLRIITIMLVITSVSELCCSVAGMYQKYFIKLSIYHFYNIIQASLISAYFIYAIAPRRMNSILTISSMLWIAAGIANLLFLQPLGTLNSNMLVLESFGFVTMSLYFIYYILKNDLAGNIFRFVHFRMAFILLVYWSSTLFFWAFVKIFWYDHWQHILTLMYIQSVIEIIVYTGIAATLYYSGKKMAGNETQ